MIPLLNHLWSSLTSHPFLGTPLSPVSVLLPSELQSDCVLPYRFLSDALLTES